MCLRNSSSLGAEGSWTPLSTSYGPLEMSLLYMGACLLLHHFRRCSAVCIWVAPLAGVVGRVRWEGCVPAETGVEERVVIHPISPRRPSEESDWLGRAALVKTRKATGRVEKAPTRSKLGKLEDH